jgi:hypothetical protein
VLTLPSDSSARKEIPLLSGCLRYFPAALAGVARISKAGNDKHNPGEPLHHARGKSMDHGDCILRHLVDLQDHLSAGNESQAIAEADAICWRALALSQELHERFGGAPLAPGARTTTLPRDCREWDERRERGDGRELSR